METSIGYTGDFSSPENLKMIKKMRKDMNFIGIYTVIVGVISCISIIGAVIGIPTIFSGLRLRESAMAFDDFVASGNMGAISYALERQQKYYSIAKILVIVSIVVGILSIIAAIFISLFIQNKII